MLSGIVQLNVVTLFIFYRTLNTRSCDGVHNCIGAKYSIIYLVL